MQLTLLLDTVATLACNMSKKWWGGGSVTSLGLLLSVAFLPDWLRTYLAILFLIATIIFGIEFLFAKDTVILDAECKSGAWTLSIKRLS